MTKYLCAWNAAQSGLQRGKLSELVPLSQKLNIKTQLYLELTKILANLASHSPANFTVICNPSSGMTVVFRHAIPESDSTILHDHRLCGYRHVVSIDG